MAEDEKTIGDFLKTGPARVVGAGLSAIAYGLKGPEAAEEVYKAGKKAFSKTKTYLTETSVKLKDKINLKNGIKAGATLLGAYGSNKLADKAYDKIKDDK